MVFISTLPLLAGLFSSWHPLLDSLSDIRVPLAFLTLLLSLPLLFTRQRKAGFSAIVFAIMMITLGDMNSGVPPKAAASPGRIYKLLQINLRYDNAAHSKLLDAIVREKPDIVIFQEASSNWLATLKESGYSLSGCMPKDDPIGATGILLSGTFSSHFSPLSSQTAACHKASTTRGYVFALPLSNDADGGLSLNLLSVHLSWPWPFGQDRQLTDLENGVLNQHLDRHDMRRATVIAGDFNAVTWSHAVKRIEAMTDTTHISKIGPSWLSYRFPDQFRKYLGLPIDQILVSKNIRVISVKRLQSIGSDHLPVMVEFQFN